MADDPSSPPGYSDVPVQRPAGRFREQATAVVLVDLDLDLNHTMAAVSDARHRLAEVVCDRCAAAVDDASLVVSELVANAVEHSTGRVTMRALYQPARLRIEVQDDNSDPPSMTTVSTRTYGGRGLPIVDAVADEWGFEPTSTGKVVWAELRC